jgi:voltage-gated potassium channel Kch
VLLVLGRIFKMSLDQRLMFAFSLAQGGEFAFVLFSFAVRYQVVEATLAATLIAVVALTMAATPLLMVVNEKLVQPRVGTREQEERETDTVEEENPVLIAGFGSFGSIVGRLLRANGIGTTVFDVDSDRVDILRKLGLKVFYGDASRNDLLRAAGAEQAKLLVLAIDDQEKALQLVETCRRNYPQLTILARARNRTEAYELYEAGVKHVIREKLDGSLRLGVEALRILGRRAYQARRAAYTFRQHDETAVRELLSMRHDKKLYMDAARQSIRDLEDLLLSDLEEADAVRDAGWDTESLREDIGSSSK